MVRHMLVAFSANETLAAVGLIASPRPRSGGATNAASGSVGARLRISLTGRDEPAANRKHRGVSGGRDDRVSYGVRPVGGPGTPGAVGCRSLGRDARERRRIVAAVSGVDRDRVLLSQRGAPHVRDVL